MIKGEESYQEICFPLERRENTMFSSRHPDHAMRRALCGKDVCWISGHFSVQTCL